LTDQSYLLHPSYTAESSGAADYTLNEIIKLSPVLWHIKISFSIHAAWVVCLISGRTSEAVESKFGKNMCLFRPHYIAAKGFSLFYYRFFPLL
jgi:hypothetical protein